MGSLFTFVVKEGKAAAANWRRFQNLAATVREDTFVKAGVLEPKAGEAHLGGPNDLRPAGDRPTVVDVAFYNEYGTDTIPARSFIHEPFEKNRAKYEKTLAGSINAVATGRMDEGGLLDQVGAAMVEDMKQAMRDSVPPPLADITIKRKGSTLTLIETEQLIKSLSYKSNVSGNEGSGEVMEDISSGGGGEGVEEAGEGLGEIAEVVAL